MTTELKLRSLGTRLTLRLPSRVAETNTDGWAVIIGGLGKDGPRLEIWLDRFSGYGERRFWACFACDSQKEMKTLTGRLDKRLVPHRVITDEDTEYGRFVMLSNRLGRNEFNMPIQETYEGGKTFLGIYDQTKPTSERISPYFVQRAAAFFEAVARSQEGGRAENEQDETYPRVENRAAVVSHLRRERSRLLATDRKILDDYQCQVCGLRFDETYGKLGVNFAEAHHLTPLSKLREEVRTMLEDLATVCANCHRMLHRMAGERGDLAKLRALVKKKHSKIR